MNQSPQSSCTVCLFLGLIRLDIFICSQMHRKVIMEYFPKNEQNSEKRRPPDCLSTLMVKIAHCNWEAVVFEWDFECGPSGWCSLQFITVANYLCCKSTLLHRKKGKKGREQTCRTVNQLHGSRHMSGAMKAPYVWIVCCRLIIRHVSPPEGHEDGLWKWSACFQISFIQATTKNMSPFDHSFLSFSF